jgi:twitching motility protein PilU
MSLDPLLKVMVEKGASDLFVTAGVPPSMKVNGQLVPLTRTPLSPEQSREMVLGSMDETQREDFLDSRECNFALVRRGLGRFRVSAFVQRGLVGMVLRRIETNIPRIADLGLPEVLGELSMMKRGLVFLVGATGTGKSTTLAAMLGHRNQHATGHIVSIEDPIEYMHQHANCIVTQREVGVDTESYEVALRNTLRQAPDVIMIGEVRSRETMEYALAFAETGHLCLSTLHANNANQALERIIHFFPHERHAQIWMDLSLNLRAVVAQQLLRTVSGDRRAVAVEVMLNTSLVADHVRKGEVHLLKDVMQRSRDIGMQTFDQSLLQLYSAGVIDYESALAHADAPNDLRLLIKLGPDADPSLLRDAPSLTLAETEDRRAPRRYRGGS